ncbi:MULTISPECIES: protein-L-isoaspartate(D-aspartate) O-methyltransferase [unclassified Aminobacter]|jgi:protein-L-isoaspartate(D-aspartate) O-methyltransferase|uniref:protein-L-isoaspartate(D-aspartate) O-methyltransferase n=1 Tax=unclassified Aminobacter TaxID=2644704 RepID=UPI0004B2DE47|nr:MULTISPECIES: protein-L-isoaspartate(D-aspartate) O-methyltransferase [unclassified Aminobacter]TWG60778.1 protein-L-isoaspartate(D-aspartate) O-methyltransferase [Aminobacter sp. J44]TWH24399.1 protein-L-isoaspartate(D-aspartate) O-methyltransferase [Aminobacter sp. J15]
MDEAERERFAAFLLRMRGAGLDRRDLMAAVEATPRASFVPPQWRADAWSDRSLPIECGETIEGIDLQMRAISMLSLEPGSRVLEIGTGSGFTSAVMARLSARVLSLDRFRTLCEAARTRHETLGLSNILIRQADGSQGAPAEGPFDRIIAWASYESLPRSFVDQLASGGIMIAPIGPGDGVQVMEKLTKLGSRFEREVVGNVRFQPMAAGVAAAI